MRLREAQRGRALILFALAGLFANNHIAAQDYKNVGVCKILAESKNSHLQYVAIDADLVIARPHGVILVDHECPSIGVLLEFPSNGEDESVASLEKSIRDGSLSLESTGTFKGKIKRNAATKRLVLSLRRVQNLQPKDRSLNY